MAIEIVSAKKSALPDEASVLRMVAKARPQATVENIAEDGDGWLVRLKHADVPPFMKKKKKDDDSSDDSDSSDLADEDSDSDSDDDSDSGDSDSDSPKDKGKSDDGGDLVSELKSLMDDLKHITDEVQGKGEEVMNKAQEHKDKLDEAQNVLGDKEEGGGPPIPDDLGPTPGGPPAGGPPAGPGGPGLGGPPKPGMGASGAPPVPRRPGVPTGRRNMLPPGQVSAFSKRRTEVIKHHGVGADGQKITLVAAANEINSDPQFNEYEVVAMTENPDGTYSAKLRLK